MDLHVLVGQVKKHEERRRLVTAVFHAVNDATWGLGIQEASQDPPRNQSHQASGELRSQE